MKMIERGKWLEMTILNLYGGYPHSKHTCNQVFIGTNKNTKTEHKLHNYKQKLKRRNNYKHEMHKIHKTKFTHEIQNTMNKNGKKSPTCDGSFHDDDPP